MISDDFDLTVVILSMDDGDSASVLTPTRIIQHRRSTADDNDAAVCFHQHPEAVAGDSRHVYTQIKTAVLKLF